MKIQTGTAEQFREMDRPKIEEGVYSATLKEVKEIRPGKYGDRVAFIYTILGNEEVDLAYVCQLPEVATENSKFGSALISHGVDLTKKETIDTDNLPNIHVKVMVEDYEYEVEKDGEKFNKVGSTITKVKSLV